MDAEYNIPLMLVSIGFLVLDGGIIYLYKEVSRNALLEKKDRIIGATKGDNS